MNAVWIMLAGVGLTVAISLMVIVYLRQHLHRMLSELCGSETRAAFWAAFTNVTLALVPLVVSLALEPRSSTDEGFWLAIIAGVDRGLIGLAVAVVTIGMVMQRSITRVERERAWAQRAVPPVIPTPYVARS